ncbi:hypothetical protein V6Z77_010213 [Aspergillus fumigatus]
MAARAEGTGGQAGAGFEGRPAAARVTKSPCGPSNGEPERPTLYGRAGQRTDHPIQNGPPPARSGPGNVCTHDHGPVEVGGSMWKARAASPLVACGLRRPLLRQAGRLSVTGGAQVPS